MNIFCGAITEVVKKLVSPFMETIMENISYLVRYKRNANDLRKQMTSLGELKADVQRSVDSARMKREVIKVVVESWLSKVNQMQSKETTLHHVLEESKGCLQGGCPGRYQVGKDARHMLDDVKELLNEGRNFSAVSDPSPLPPSLESMQTLDFQVYGSTKLVMDQIMKALKHEDINMVGVYGIGGVGKTTLMKEVAKKLRNERFFDQVVMVTVSQDPDLMKIQGAIAENLGLKLAEEDLHVRARCLLDRLKMEKRILLVLDDLWKPLNLLEQVGIPYGNNCKVVLTTRLVEVCNQMQTQFNVEVKVLSEIDSWALFKWAVGDHIEDDSTLFPVAKQIVKECGGLPLAIVTIARALRAKDLSVWKDVASQLKKSSSSPDIEGMHEKVLCSIKLSYDFLASNATKFCFLLCCMFPEDFSISEDDLLLYVVGEGVFEDTDTLMETRNRLHTHIERLKGSCLLFDDSEQKGHVKMHDVVRDVSIWIASKEGHDFVVKSGKGLTQFSDRESLWKCKRLSLIQNFITQLPQRLDCSQLMTLSLRDNMDLLYIPDGFFQEMVSLKTLDLENTNISFIPSSLSCLTDLRVLRISRRRWTILPGGPPPYLDVSFLGKLKKLEILYLQDSNAVNLPQEIGELTNLKSLNLSGNPRLTIPPNTLRRLSLLEELDIGRVFDERQISILEEGRISMPCLYEIASLSALTTLNMWVSNIDCLNANIPLRWENLTCFSITLGSDPGFLDEVSDKCSSSVYIHEAFIPQLTDWEMYLLERAEGLQFYQCRGLGVIRGLNNLRALYVEECYDMEYVLSTTGVVSSLERLYLNSLPNLKAIWTHGSLPPYLPTGNDGGCFNNLKFLWVNRCNSLKHILPMSLAQDLLQLEDLDIRNCSNLEEIIVMNDDGIEEKQLTTVVFPRLRHLELRALPNLSMVSQGVFLRDDYCYWPSLETLIIMQCPNLRRLPGLWAATKLRKIEVKKEWFDGLELDYDDHHKSDDHEDNKESHHLLIERGVKVQFFTPLEEAAGLVGREFITKREFFVWLGRP